jgi:hypothetical protein
LIGRSFHQTGQRVRKPLLRVDKVVSGVEREPAVHAAPLKQLMHLAGAFLDRLHAGISRLFLLCADLADYSVRLGENIPLARLVCNISALENEAGVIKEPTSADLDLNYSFMHSSDQFNSPFFLIFSGLSPFYNGFAKKDKKILKFTKKYKSLIDKE